MAKEAKTADKQAKEVKKGTTKKKVNKGQALACQVCGMSVVTKEVGDLVVEEDSVLLCCGKPIKDKATVKKAVKK